MRIEDILNCSQFDDINSANVRKWGALKDDYRNNAIVPFIGAGMAIPPFASWREVLKELVAINDDVKEVVEEKLNKGQYEEAAGYACNNIKDFHKDVIDYFTDDKIKDDTLSPGIKLIPELFDGPVVTTNYDSCLEYVYKSKSKEFENVAIISNMRKYDSVVRDVVLNNKHYLIKLHGSVKNEDSIILTQARYSELYKSIKFKKAIKYIVASKKLLFLGCALAGDRYNLLMKKVAKEAHYNNNINHYALMELPYQEEGMTVDEYRKLLITKREELGKLGVNPVWYPNNMRHEPLLDLLRLLMEKPLTDVPGFGAAAQRAKQVAQEFYGREELLDQVNAKIGECKLAIICGGPGEGKSYLALKTGLKYADLGYKCVLIDAEYVTGVYQSLGIKDDCSMDKAREYIVNKLEDIIKRSGEKAFLIFDNLGNDLSDSTTSWGTYEQEMLGVIDDINQKHQETIILVTTRSTIPYKSVSLRDGMKSGEAINYLLDVPDDRKVWPTREDGTIAISAAERNEIAQKLIEKYGKLPIVLNMLKNMAEFEGGYLALLDDNLVISDKNDSLVRLVEKLIESLSASGAWKVMADAMLISAYLPSEDVSFNLLCKTLNKLGHDQKTEAGLIKDIYSINDRITLFDRVGDHLVIHKEYQDAILRSSKLGQNILVRNKILRELLKTFGDITTWSYYGYNKKETYSRYQHELEVFIDKVPNEFLSSIDADISMNFEKTVLMMAWYTGLSCKNVILADKFYKHAEVFGDGFIKGLAFADRSNLAILNGNNLDSAAPKIILSCLKNAPNLKEGSFEYNIYYFRLILSYLVVASNSKDHERVKKYKIDVIENTCREKLSEPNAMNKLSAGELIFYSEQYYAAILNEHRLNRLSNHNNEELSFIDKYVNACGVIEECFLLEQAFRDNLCLLSAGIENELWISRFEQSSDINVLIKAIIEFEKLESQYISCESYADATRERCNIAAASNKLAQQYRLLIRKETDPDKKTEYLELFKQAIDRGFISLACAHKLREDRVMLDDEFEASYNSYLYQLYYTQADLSVNDQKTALELLDYAADCINTATNLIEGKVGQLKKELTYKRYIGALLRKRGNLLDEGQEKEKVYELVIRFFEDLLSNYPVENNEGSHIYTLFEYVYALKDAGSYDKAIKTLEEILTLKLSEEDSKRCNDLIAECALLGTVLN